MSYDVLHCWEAFYVSLATLDQLQTYVEKMHAEKVHPQFQYHVPFLQVSHLHINTG